MEKVLLQINKLVTGYRRGNILHEIPEMELYPGELICMLGPNGAGKSTLLRTILGLEKALGGEVFFSGIESGKIAVQEKAKIVSVVLTDKIDDDFLTAYEIIASGRYPYGNFLGKLNDSDKKIIDRAIESIGISAFASKYFHHLSDGEKQKVMIARAIAQDTQLIFLDEPVAFVDSPSKVAIMNIIKSQTTKNKKGILMATHDIDSSLKFADRLWLIGKNGLHKLGKPDELVESGGINTFFDQEDVIFNRKTLNFESKK